MFAISFHDSETFSRTGKPAADAFRDQCSLFTLYALRHRSKRQHPCFHRIAHSLKKPPGIGVPPLFSNSRRRSEVLEAISAARCIPRRSPPTVALTLSGLSH